MKTIAYLVALSFAIGLNVSPARAASGELCSSVAGDAAAQACGIANEIRRKHGLKEMKVDPKLVEMARIQAQHLANKFGNPCTKSPKIKCLSHKGPNGNSLSDRMRSVGLYTIVGENINYGYDDLAGAFYNGWMESPAHKKNLMHGQFVRQGYARVGDYRVHVMAEKEVERKKKPKKG